MRVALPMNRRRITKNRAASAREAADQVEHDK
jgi:hypothetical protein